MGQREDLVRQRLNSEDRDRRITRRQASEEISRAKHMKEIKYNELLEMIETESKRIIDALQDADWSKAELHEFTTKKRWWWKDEVDELACLQICEVRCWDNSLYETLRLRSDNVLLYGFEPMFYGDKQGVSLPEPTDDLWLARTVREQLRQLRF